MSARRLFPAAFVAVALLLSGSCKTMEMASQLGTSIALSQGAITEEQAQSINRSATAVARSFEEFTAEQEYYVGRSVGASVITKYQPVNDQNINHYINLIGQTLSRFSDYPETFGGYHFLLLESDEINAFAAPGGLIFVTRGMLRICRDENELAAVLAHEIAHVQSKHGLQAIKKSRVTSALTILAAEGARNFGGARLAELTETFEASVGDVVMTLTNSGYSRRFEREADLGAVAILKRAGYDPAALVSVLSEMKNRLRPGGVDFARTHPDPADRILDIQPLTGLAVRNRVSGAQQRRFDSSMRRL